MDPTTPPPPSKPAPPLTTRECADFLGVGTDYVVAAIRSGELRAEAIRKPGARKTLYRIFETDFVAWLKAINWSRLPTHEDLARRRAETDAA